MQAGCKQVRWGRYEGESLWKSSQLNKTCCRPPNGGELITDWSCNSYRCTKEFLFTKWYHSIKSLLITDQLLTEGMNRFFLLLLVFGWACFSMLFHCCCIPDLPPVSSQWRDWPIVSTTQFPELGALVSWVHVEGSLKEVTQSQHVINKRWVEQLAEEVAAYRCWVASK